MSGRSGLALALVACYAAACVLSLWNRGGAILFFAIASLATVRFILPPIAERVLAGIAIGAIAGGLGIGLPGVGDLIDAVGASVAIVLMFVKLRFYLRRMVLFFARLPFGVACFGLYLILWSAARGLPPRHSMTAAQHAVLFHAAAALLACAVAVLYLVIVVAVARVFDVSASTAVIYTVGYPWYLVLFLASFLFRNGDHYLSDR